MCCATMESNALIYLPIFELRNTGHIYMYIYIKTMLC